MMLLRINDFIIDMDDETAIGIDVQGLDLTKPDKRTVNQSNSFSIPSTINNLKAIGYLGGFQNNSEALYNNYSVQYYINNEEIISGSYVTIQEVTPGDKGRIKLQIVRKSTLWDDMKGLGWNTFASEYFDYLVANHNIPDSSNQITDTYRNSIINYLDNPDRALKLYPAYTNEADYLGLDFLTPRSDTFQIGLFDSSVPPTKRLNGTHYWSDATTLFKFIENKYSVNFDITGSHSDNPFNQNSFINCIWLFRNIILQYSGGNYFFFTSTSYYPYMQNEVDENTSGDLYGLVFSILNTLGIVIEQYGATKYRLRDISLDINTKRPIDIGLKLSGDPKIMPFVKEYSQESIVKYDTYADGINSVNTRKIVKCNNKNITYRKDIIKVENFVPAIKDDLLNYGVDRSFEQYKVATWKESNEAYTWNYKFGGSNYSELISKADYKKVTLIDLQDQWGILDTALNDPLYVEQKCWLTPTQYAKINNWTLYYIPELAASYYINKVKGYNPEKSLQAVTLQLIRINNKTPE